MQPCLHLWIPRLQDPFPSSMVGRSKLTLYASTDTHVGHSDLMLHFLLFVPLFCHVRLFHFFDISPPASTGGTMTARVVSFTSLQLPHHTAFLETKLSVLYNHTVSLNVDSINPTLSSLDTVTTSFESFLENPVLATAIAGCCCSCSKTVLRDSNCWSHIFILQFPATQMYCLELSVETNINIDPSQSNLQILKVTYIFHQLISVAYQHLSNNCYLIDIDGYMQ